MAADLPEFARQGASCVVCLSVGKKNLDMTDLRQNLPIGIFDSGVGGLTVYRALHNRLPNEHFVYLGDTARVPYGTKSMATVERYALENSQFLASVGIKLLVVACNTASALALPKIRDRIGIDVVGVIGPEERKAVEMTKANAEFEKLSPGRKKEILRYLGFLKSEEALMRNIDRVVKYLRGETTETLHALMRKPKT